MDWKDISIKKYLEIQDVMESEMDDSEKMIQTANIIYDCDVTELSLVDYNAKISEMKRFINEKPENDVLKNEYVVNGTRYIVKSSVDEILANEFMDFQNYWKDEDIIGCISCFFVPEGHSYNKGYDIPKVKEDIGSLPITTANALAFFFKSQYVVLLVLSQRYSLKLMKTMNLSKTQIKEIEDSLTSLGVANLVATLSY